MPSDAAHCCPIASVPALNLLRQRDPEHWRLHELSAGKADTAMAPVHSPCQLACRRQGLNPRWRRIGCARSKGNDMMSGMFARIVALIGAAAILWRRQQGTAPKPAWGSAPVVPAAKPQGSLPTLKMPTAKGWSDGQTPVAAPGLKVNAFATGLKHPRWIHVLPDGGVLVAEAQQVPEPVTERVRLCDAGHHETRRRAWRQREPHHPVARREWRRHRRKARNFHGGPEPAVRHGAAWATRSMSATPMAWWPFPMRRARTASPRRAETHHLQARRALDAEPAAKPRRQEAFCRGRLAQQYRRERHGRGGRPGRDLRTRSGKRQQPHLCRRPAQSGRPRMGAADRRALDRGQ